MNANLVLLIVAILIGLLAPKGKRKRIGGDPDYDRQRRR